MSWSVRGVDYDTPEAIAEAFGVSAVHVKNAKRAGRLDKIGISPAQSRASSGPPPMPVCIRGVMYKSANEASKRLGVNTSTIYAALHYGRADSIGLGRGRPRKSYPPGKSPRPTPFNALPVKIGALSWPSIRAAAADLDVKRSSLRDHIRNGNSQWLIKKAMEFEQRKIKEEKARISAEEKALSMA